MTVHPVIDLLAELVRQPSINPEHLNKEQIPTERQAQYGEATMADCVERHFTPLPVTVTRSDVQPGRPNVEIRLAGADRQAPALLLEAHMDTVDIVDMEAPFEPQIRDGRLYGRGSCDTKSSLAAMMQAVIECAREGLVPPRDVILLAACDEEYQHSGIVEFCRRQSSIWGAIVGEPTELAIIPAHKGQHYFRIVASGLAAHTSTPQHGRNAIMLMTHAMQAIQQNAEPWFAAHRIHPLCGPSVMCVSQIRGGYSAHIVPDRCEITIDYRPTPGTQWSDLRSALQQWFANSPYAEQLAAHVHIEEPHHSSFSLDTPPEHPLVSALQQATAAEIGSAEISGVSYNTDAGYLSDAGIPAVVFGPGSIAQAHKPIEYVDIEQVVQMTAILKRFLLECQ